eukprot:m.163207 g.163207  ORF g.163207 m.163207 type:complete len:199 (-) comp16389_c0_seq6:2327-2923(-)
MRLVASGDNIKTIKGTFSGTLGYITSGLDEGRSFSELVKEAYDKGFTEPDPRDDLSGMDVARKALILSRVAGWQREMSVVSVEALFPSNLGDVTVQAFLEGLTGYDDEIRKRQKDAVANNCVLRYVAVATPEGCEVGLKSVPKDSPIGQLRGTDNILNVTSDIYAQPLVIQGSGAGPDITAAGVVADMVDVARTFPRK